MSIRKIERPRKPGPPSVRQRDLNIRASMDEAEMAFYMGQYSEALWEVADMTRYLVSREKRRARRELLRASGAMSWVWVYRLFSRKSKHAVLYDLMCTPAHRELCGRAVLNGRGEGLGRDESQGELAYV